MPPRKPRPRSEDLAPPAAVPSGVPGPVDREHFLDAQRRNRRASWRASLFAPVAVAVSGVPLCAIVTPMLYVPLLVVAHVAAAAGVLPPALWDTLYETTHLLPKLWNQLWHDGPPVSWRLVATMLVVPGAVAMFVAWLAIRATLRATWAGGVLRGMHARRPDPAALEEHRVVNVVEEIAVAAGIRPPRVLIAEVTSPNALVLGLGVNDATIVMTRGLLGALTRDELQAVAAYCVASVANGDLKIAATFMSVFHTWGALGLLTDAPFMPGNRAALRTVAGTLWHSLLRPSNDRAARAARRRAADLLLMRASLEGSVFGGEDDDVVVLSGQFHPLTGCFVYLPLLVTLGLASIVFRATIELCTALIFGPVMAWLWRSRRNLADATAVELTRDPEALAHAVRKLSGPPGVTPEAAPFSFLCFVRATKTPKSARDVPDVPAVTNYVIGMLPDPEDRLARLRAIGASYRELSDAARTPPPVPGDLRFVLLWGAAAVSLVAFLMVLNVVTTGALLWGVWALLGVVFVTIPGWVAALVSRID